MLLAIAFPIRTRRTTTTSLLFVYNIPEIEAIDNPAVYNRTSNCLSIGSCAVVVSSALVINTDSSKPTLPHTPWNRWPPKVESMVRRDRSEQGDDPAFPQKKRRRLVRRKDPASQRRKQLEKYFEGDSEGRFHLEQPHGRGGQASVWKIKYVEPGSSGARAQGERFLVVKLADPARGSDVEGVTIERAVLEVRVATNLQEERY